MQLYDLWWKFRLKVISIYTYLRPKLLEVATFKARACNPAIVMQRFHYVSQLSFNYYTHLLFISTEVFYCRQIYLLLK